MDAKNDTTGEVGYTCGVIMTVAAIVFGGVYLFRTCK